MTIEYKTRKIETFDGVVVSCDSQPTDKLTFRFDRADANEVVIDIDVTNSRVICISTVDLRELRDGITRMLESGVE